MHEQATGAAEKRRAPAEIDRAVDVGGTLIPGIASAHRQGELRRDIIGGIGKDGVGFRIDIAKGQCGHAAGQTHIEDGACIGIQIIEADQPVEIAHIEQRLHFLAELLVVVKSGHIDIDGGQRIEIDRGGAVILAIASDGAERHIIAGFKLHEQRTAIGFHVLLGIVQATARIINVVERLNTAAQTGNEPVAATRIAVVIGIIARQAHEQRAAIIFDRPAHRPDLLIVIFQPGGQVGAEAVAREHRATTANGKSAIPERHGKTGGDIRLIIGAIGGAQIEPGCIAQTAGHIFDRAANRIAAIKCALWAAQNLDALDIVDFQDRALRPVQIDIIQIDADTGLEPGHRILLPHAANERGKSVVGAARRLQRDAWGGLRNVRDVDGTGLLQLLARIGSDGDRHVLQPFFTAAGGHHDHAAGIGKIVALVLRCGRSGNCRSHVIIRVGLGGCRYAAERRHRYTGEQRHAPLSCRKSHRISPHYRHGRIGPSL